MSKRSSWSDYPVGNASSTPGKSKSSTNNGYQTSSSTEAKKGNGSYMLDRWSQSSPSADPWSSAKPSTFQHKSRG
ncbi:hypothetical protein N7508_005324 [Penicillium antarcticum]|uniref:uncharacterized protein n=1 Tax=Penicillium antarcticum TaxID=416450 RepID=UPI0023A3A431|nr:uncharacterized protein N7508_005324 [Penicillium antarcticum]KAJ5306309.1 hypothetical protein N7508_005324 [Penicillium antarcticum]